jgi:hypothetical protein
MKKTILVALMVLLVSTPCLAEVEPDGIFSIGGTQWEATYIFPPEYWGGHMSEIGFYKGEVYGLGGLFSFYVNLGIASFFMVGGVEIHYPLGAFYAIYFGFMQPIGIGVMTHTRIGRVPPYIFFYLSSLVKTNDDWTPDVE